MYKIAAKRDLNSSVVYMEIEAPFVAKKAKAGQFIIFRVDELSERVPLTIAGYDREKGTVAIIFQKVGSPPTPWRSSTRAITFRTSSVPWAAPRMSRVRSGSAWLAAAWAAPLLCPPPVLSRKPAPWWTSS